MNGRLKMKRMRSLHAVPVLSAFLCHFDLAFGNGKTKRALPEIRRVLTGGAN